MRSTTSYYQVAVNLPTTYYGNVTVSLTVRAHASTFSAATMVKQLLAKCQQDTRQVSQLLVMQSPLAELGLPCATTSKVQARPRAGNAAH